MEEVVNTRYYEKKLKMYENLLVAHLEQEPLKLCKKKHQQWEKHKQELQEKIDDASSQLYQEYQHKLPSK